MAKFNLDATKGKIKDIQGNIERGKTEFQEFEKKKQDNFDARMNVENSDMEVDTKKATIEGLNLAREKILDEGDKLAHKLDGDYKMLSEMAEQVQEAKNANEQQLSEIKKKQAMVDKAFGIGFVYDKAVGEINDSQHSMEGVQKDIVAGIKEVETLQHNFGRKQ